jgi:hypothetical protein
MVFNRKPGFVEIFILTRVEVRKSRPIGLKILLEVGVGIPQRGLQAFEEILLSFFK